MHSAEVSTSSLMRRSVRALLASPDHELELSSLARVVRDDPELQRVLDEELAPRRAQLDLHLDGQSVHGHRTAARPFGKFVVYLSDTVRALANDVAGVTRSSQELLIEPGPGSVRAIFMAPERHEGTANAIDVEAEDEVLVEDDSYSEALRRIASVFANSDPSGPDDDALAAAIATLPAVCRPPLKRALDEAHRQAWTLRGNFSQRGLGTTAVSVGVAAIDHLRERLGEKIMTTTSWEGVGYLDGHTWSSGTMRFIGEGRSGPLSASFGNSQVQMQVGQLDSVPSQRVRARFSVIETSSPALARSKRSFILEAVEAIQMDEPQFLF